MALRDQPYLPLYVQDFLTDEKLANCSAASTGVYIRLMCLMHKSHDYGKILLRQKERQTGRQVLDFAEKLARQMPYKTDAIAEALEELIDEEVVYIKDNALCQKRMINDAIISEKRSKSGKMGAEKTNSKGKDAKDFAGQFAGHFAAAKSSANSENENECENECKSKKKKKQFVPPTLEEVAAYCQERGNNVDPRTFWDYFNEGGWTDSEGKPVKNWKQKIITWEKHEGGKKNGTQTAGRNAETGGEKKRSKYADFKYD